MVKKVPAYRLRKSGLFLLAAFLLPLLAREMHAFFPHHTHDHHLQHCDVSGVHLHDPDHYAPENCAFCAIVYTHFFNDAVSPLMPVPVFWKTTTEIIYTGKLFTADLIATPPRGPPAILA